MTRKDYVKLAAALAEAREHALYWGAPSDDDAKAAAFGVSIAATKLADALATDNPRFDRERFLTAAGY